MGNSPNTGDAEDVEDGMNGMAAECIGNVY